MEGKIDLKFLEKKPSPYALETKGQRKLRQEPGQKRASLR